MGLFNYLNIADGGEEDALSLGNDDNNNMDFGKLFKEKGVFGALDGINKAREAAYKDEVARTKLERSKSFFGSLATLGGQMIASGMGARQFNPIKDQVPQYNERLQRLRDAKRAEDAETNNKSLLMMVRELDQKRADEWQNKEREDKAARDSGRLQWDKDKFDANLGETIRHNKEMEGAAMTRALRPVGGSSGGSKKAVKAVAPKEDYVNVYSDDGTLKRIPSRLVSVNDYWKFAKNALVRDGKMESYEGNDKLYQILKDRSVYKSIPALKELNEKAGGRLFPNIESTVPSDDAEMDNQLSNGKVSREKDGWSLKE